MKTQLVLWAGGECPVDTLQLVQVLYGSGELDEPVPAWVVNWSREYPAAIAPDEVIAYRVIDPEEESLHLAARRDHDRLVRELDFIINGRNAAKQASLADLVQQLRQSRDSLTWSDRPAPGNVKVTIEALATSGVISRYVKQYHADCQPASIEATFVVELSRAFKEVQENAAK